MDISSESQTSKIFPFPGTNCIRHEIIETDTQGEPSYTALANQLVHEWLNQALDNFELTYGDSLCQSNTCELHCETGDGSRSDNQVCNMPGDVVKNSTPSLKQLHYEAFETSDNNLVNMSVGQFFAEEKQLHGKCRNGTEVNWKSLSCSLLATTVPHKVMRHNNLCADPTEFPANMHVREIDHSKGPLRHTKSETFLQHIMKEVDYLESDRTGDHSERNLVSSSLRICDLPKLHNLLPANTSKTKHYECLQTPHTSDENLNQNRTPVGQLFSTASLNNVSSAVEDTADAFNAAVNANSDCTSVHKDAVMNDNIGRQDPCENIACKVTHSSSDTVRSDDWISTENGCQIFLSGPGVQVSFSLLLHHTFVFIIVFFFTAVNGIFEGPASL